jgi:signal transduction histidine kinase
VTDRVLRIASGILLSVSLAVSLSVLLLGRYEPGIQLAVVDDGLVVADVVPHSQADRDGVEPGMRVVTANEVELFRFGYYEYPEQNPDDPLSSPGQPVLVGPERPTPIDVGFDQLALLSTAQIQTIDLIRPEVLEQWSPATAEGIQTYYYPGSWAMSESGVALVPGLLLVLVGLWWLGSGRGGESLRGIAIPIAAGVATPLIVQPLLATGAPLWVLIARVVVLSAVVAMALALTNRIEDASDRKVAFVGIAAFGSVAVVSGLFQVSGLVPVSSDFRNDGVGIDFLYWAATALVPLVPGLIAAGPIDLERLRTSGTSSRRLLQSTELALAGATPLFALATDRPPYLWPIGVWLGAIVLAGRFTVRPLARLATRAQLQRDLVVAATEAERARVAADIHDDALQELTLLVRRLETAGDTEGAEMGRGIADRLRAICGDLRLPILDDLGVGPALDWLVIRIERLAGGEVRLERSDGTRPPPEVELAIFRIAQEALANAVKHGAPPIVVRYRSNESGASLSIDDAGPGIGETAAADAEQAGRLGLLNMQQRAEQIGALLDIRRWPAGGTHVALEWRTR